MWQQVAAALQASFSRMLESLVSLLPGLVAMFVALIVAGIIGGAVRWLITRVLRGFRLDERLDEWGFSAVAEWSPGRSPTRLVAGIAFWMVVLVGLLMGLAAFETTLMTTMVERLVAYLPNVFIAVVLMLFGVVMARFLARGVLIGAVNLKLQSAGLISVGVKWLVLVLAAAMAFEHLSIGGDVLKLAFGIIFGGIVLAMSLAIGLGSKDAVSRTWERKEERSGDAIDAPYQHL